MFDNLTAESAREMLALWAILVGLPGLACFTGLAAQEWAIWRDIRAGLAPALVLSTMALFSGAMLLWGAHIMLIRHLF